MRSFKKFIALILCFLMVALVIPQSVYASIGESINSISLSNEQIINEHVEPYVIGEVEEKRTETSKTFRMSDGSYYLTDYGFPIHFQGNNKKWVDYDNSLILEAATDSEDLDGYVNCLSDISIKFSKNSKSSNLLKISSDKYKISIGFVDANNSKSIEIYDKNNATENTDINSVSMLHKLSSGVLYEEVLSNVDLEYIVTGNNVKENIIIKDNCTNYNYIFELNLKNLTPELTEQGELLLKDSETGDVILYIPAGYMYDNNGEISQNVTYSLTHKNGHKYEFSVTVDEEWINSPERAFPVTIDPTILKYHTLYSGGRIKDTFVSSTNDSNYGSHAWLSIGTNGTSEYTSLIGLASSTNPAIPDLPAIPKSAVIVKAELKLRARSDTETGVTVGAYQVTSDWDSYDVVYSTLPGHEVELLDYFTVTSGSSEYSLDITSAMQKWYNNYSEGLYKKGIKLKTISGTGLVKLNAVNDQNYQHAYPSFVISYRDTKGLESIWSYASHGAGNAGMGNVNLFNGNLVLVRDDTTTKGLLLPVAVSHVYNGYMADKEFTGNNDDIIAATYTNMKIGKGWKLSVQETITTKILEDNTTWYVYNDSDGTELYFLPTANEEGLHNSEDGYPIYLKINSSSNTYRYEITDDYNNTKYFNNNGYLVKMTDEFGNARFFTYNSNGQLTQISLTPKNGTNIGQVSFIYNSLGALQKIINLTDIGDCTTFYYSTTYNGAYSETLSGYLRQVVSAKNGTCSYYYNSDGTLSYTYDSDSSYRIDYSYLAYQGVQRVSSVTERSGNIVGQTIGLSYNDNKTIIRTCGQDDSFGNNDDNFTTYLMDDYGRTVCSYSSNLSGTEIYGAASAKYTPTVQASKQNNKITVDSVKGITTENLVLNGNCESSTSWSGAVSGSGYTWYMSASNKLYGSKALQITSSSTANGYFRIHQTVTIPEAGTYTLSAYIKTSNIVSGSNGGAYITFAGKESERLTGTTNTHIQDGWVRVSVTKSFSSATTALVELRQANSSGTSFFDCIQVEKGDVASNYNLLDNGGMSLSSGWSASPSYFANAGRRAIQVVGNISTYNFEKQNISLNIPKETTLVLSGWGKANSVPTGIDKTNHNRTFRVVANILYTDGTREDQAADFNPNITEWQYSAATIVPKKDITSITVYLSYDYNGNIAYFDDVCLTVEPSQTYKYDGNGKMISTVNQEGNQSLINYATNGIDLSNFENILGHKYSIDYLNVNGNQTHAVSKIEKYALDEETIDQTLRYEYDTYGNVIKTVLSVNGNNKVVQSISEYTEQGNFLLSVTDSLGGIISKGYTAEKLLKYIENSLSNRTGYLYDYRDRLTDVFYDTDEDGSADASEIKVKYIYENNRLKNIVTNSTTYTYVYDGFGNITQVYAGDILLVSFTYRSGNGKLIKRTFANSDVEEYTYDELDRLVSVKYNNVVTYTLVYDTNGMLARCIDNKSAITHEYTYDSLGRLIRAWQQYTVTGVKIVSVENSYDDFGRAEGSSYVVNGETLNYSVGYGANSGLVSYITLPDTTKSAGITYSYDKFERLVSETLSSRFLPGLVHSYSYYSTPNGNETSLISQENVGSTSYNYLYDGLGNIIKITKNGVDLFYYEYSSSGSLVREYNYQTGIVTVFGYDRAGNVNGKYIFSGFSVEATAGHIMAAYPYGLVDEVSYSYGNDNWGDLLTNYDGTNISYSANYNPLNWRNANAFVWSGRALTGVTLKNNTSITYSYDAFGSRINKRVGGTTHQYVFDGNSIIAEIVTGNENYTLYYYYDAAGNIVGFRHDSVDYYFQKNWRGDVVGIVNPAGTVVTEYSYDAWGKVISVTGSMASTVGRINPIRYRGYYYDVETGFYYLNTRYYDPEVGRFVSADTTDVLAASPNSLTDKNLFAYCDNNPIMYKDDGGEFWHILVGAGVGAIVGAASSIVSQVISGQEVNWTAVAIEAVSGAVSGAINTACPCLGPIATGLVDGTISAVTYAATEKIAYGRDPSLGEVLNVGLQSGVMSGTMKYVSQEIGLVQCFISGTIVSTASCSKNIEDIQVGDKVWATNPETGETELKEVTQLFRGQTDEWVHVFAGEEEIVCTPGHPFYSPEKGWISAGELRIGDTLVTLEGSSIIIERIYREQLDVPEITYNFEVEGFHTYYVGKCDVLVHNKCKETGSYEITTSSDRVYVGKGSQKRMANSIKRLTKQGYEVVDAIWQPSSNNTTAFIDEYMKMAKYEFDFGGKLINKIMSPGAKLFELML